MVTFERPRPQSGTEGDVLFERVVAFLIDVVGFSILFGFLSNLLLLVSETLGLLVGSLSVPLLFAYFIYFEAEYGQTIGKMVMNVVVVDESGGSIGYRDSAIRTLLRIVDALPAFYIVGLVAIYFTDRNQRLGDLVADTVVVKAVERGEKL